MKDVKEGEAYIGNPVEQKVVRKFYSWLKDSWEISWFTMKDCGRYTDDHSSGSVIYTHKFYACPKDLKYYMIQLLCYGRLKGLKHYMIQLLCISPTPRKIMETDRNSSSFHGKLYHETSAETNI